MLREANTFAANRDLVNKAIQLSSLEKKPKEMKYISIHLISSLQQKAKKKQNLQTTKSIMISPTIELETQEILQIQSKIRQIRENRINKRNTCKQIENYFQKF